MKRHITVGDRVDAKHGRLIQFDAGNDPVGALVKLLSEKAMDRVWWSPHRWANGHRTSGNWEGASAIALDIDYHDERGRHAPVPEEVQDRLRFAVELGRMPGHVFHLTPRGARLIAVPDRVVTSREEYTRAWFGLAAQVDYTLEQLGCRARQGCDGLVIDRTFDLARYFFLPNTARSIPCSGGSPSPREAEVVPIDGNPHPIEHLFDWADFAEEQTSAERLPRAPKNLARAAKSFLDAAERWNADHPREYPSPGSGTCLFCGHHDCFGQLADDPSRWSCFSTDHGNAGGSWLGHEGNGAWIGSALDIEAHERGCTPRDVLITDGYLVRRRAAVAAEHADLAGVAAVRRRTGAMIVPGSSSSRRTSAMSCIRCSKSSQTRSAQSCFRPPECSPSWSRRTCRARSARCR